MSMRDISTEDMVLEIHALRELNKSLSAALSLGRTSACRVALIIIAEEFAKE
jgi:hypothetical protein